MLIERRVVWIDQIKARFFSGINIISFGSESCVIPFLDINNHWDTLMELLKLNIRLKIITPRIAQNELHDTTNLLQKIITLYRPIDIVVNDWGVMQFCAKHSHLAIHIGRQLCRSLLDCPWHMEILENESTDVKEIIASHPYNNMEKIKTLYNKGVKGLELNVLLRNFDFQSVSSLGFEVAVHCDDYLLTCGRTCLSKRIVQNRTCHDICEESLQLEPSGKWRSYFENRIPFNDYEKSMLNGLALNGKKVALPQKAGIDDMLSCGANVLIATQNKTINCIKGEN